MSVELQAPGRQHTFWCFPVFAPWHLQETLEAGVCLAHFQERKLSLTHLSEITRPGRKGSRGFRSICHSHYVHAKGEVSPWGHIRDQPEMHREAEHTEANTPSPWSWGVTYVARCGHQASFLPVCPSYFSFRQHISMSEVLLWTEDTCSTWDQP